MPDPTPVVCNLFQRGDFTLRSGARSGWKIECDALTEGDWEALALIATELVQPFGYVFGVPRGGVPFAKALERYCRPEVHTVLIAEDVVTTGGSITRYVDELKTTGKWPTSMMGMRVMPSLIGVAVFARGYYPVWVQPLFRMPAPGDHRPDGVS